MPLPCVSTAFAAQTVPFRVGLQEGDDPTKWVEVLNQAAKAADAGGGGGGDGGGTVDVEFDDEEEEAF